MWHQMSPDTIVFLGGDSLVNRTTLVKAKERMPALCHTKIFVSFDSFDHYVDFSIAFVADAFRELTHIFAVVLCTCLLPKPTHYLSRRSKPF